MTHQDGFDEFAGRCFDDPHFVTVLADYVQQEAVRGNCHFERGQISLVRRGGGLPGGGVGGDGQKSYCDHA
jgi:hypothetical protein